MTMLDNMPMAFDFRPFSAWTVVSTGLSTACVVVGATGTVAGSCMTNSPSYVASARYPIAAATRMRRASTLYWPPEASIHAYYLSRQVLLRINTDDV